MAPSEAGTVMSLKTVNEAGCLAQVGGGGRCVYGGFEGRLEFFYFFSPSSSFFLRELFPSFGFSVPTSPPSPLNPPHLYFVVIFCVSSFVVFPCSSESFSV